MDVLSVLRERARRDLELLERNRRHRDDLAKSRPVDFEMVADAEDGAQRACDFVMACNYGQCWVAAEQGEWKVYVRIPMPLEQDQLCRVSGLMALIAATFGLRYDGWGCILRTT